jgi:hypothetical protein
LLKKIVIVTNANDKAGLTGAEAFPMMKNQSSVVSRQEGSHGTERVCVSFAAKQLRDEEFVLTTED